MTVPRSRKFPSSQAEGIVGANVVGEAVHELESGYSSYVLDARGCVGFTPWFSAGAHTYQPCDADGTALPGAPAAASLAAGTEIAPVAPYYLITETSAGALTLTRR